MAVEVATDSLPLNLTARGVSARNEWAGAWFRFYNALPLQAYDAAQGTYTPLGEAYGSLPNILIGGVDESRDRLRSTASEAVTDLGFEVALTDHDAAQIEHRARRYQRDRLPIRELEPMEYLAYYPDGPITANKSATLPNGAAIPAGATYELRSRWTRNDEQVGEGEEKGKGRKRHVQRTFVDRGYLVLRFTPTVPEHGGVELKSFTIEEINPEAVKALVDAFGLPQVATVEDLPALEGWKTRLARFMDEHEKAAGGRRLYDVQALDAARLATKSSVALLYEMGGGKTATAAHWATLRGYRSVLIVTPASVVPGIIEDLGNWGFPARRLNHALVSDLLARKRQHKLARQRVKTARQRSSRTAEDEAILRHEEERLRLEGEAARKRRHLRNLKAIRRKGKARDPQGLEAEIEATARQLDSLAEQLTAACTALPAPGAQAQVDDILPDSRPSDSLLPASRPPLPDFYVASYQDLSLGDHLGIFDPWDHDHFDRQGKYLGTVRDLRGAKCTCNAPRKKQVPACPRCGASWRGEGKGGGRVCRKCGHVAWTMGQAPKRTLPVVDPKAAPWEQKRARRQRIEIRREHRLATRAGGLMGKDVFLSTYHQWSLGNRVKTLFSCVLLDEGQDAKSKTALRGAAARSLRANGKAILTGTWMKGYVTDLFWTAGWLLGFGSPLWPFPYRGGSARFLQQFGTYEFITREYADTLEVGRRKLIPSVSNLNRLWKLLSPVSIRRLKEDFLHDLPPKQRHIHWVRPSGKHELLVSHVTEAMKEVFQRELRKKDPNMGAINAALWWGRYVASCPNEHGALHFAGAWGHRINVDEASPAERKAMLDQMRAQGAYLRPRPGQAAAYGFDKVEKALEIIMEVKEAGEKAIVFTSLRGLYRTLEAAFKDRCHRPGQTREVHVHYLLSEHTVDEQMFELVDQKWAAQRAVQDREAQHKSVEAILAEAALANAQLAVAKAVLTDLRLPPEASAEEQAAAMQKAQEAVDEITTRLTFGRASVQRTAKRRRKPQVSVVYFRNLELLDVDKDGRNGNGKGQVVLPPTDEPVQLAMFAL